MAASTLDVIWSKVVISVMFRRWKCLALEGDILKLKTRLSRVELTYFEAWLISAGKSSMCHLIIVCCICKMTWQTPSQNIEISPIFLHKVSHGKSPISHLPLHKGEQLVVTNMELPRENSSSPMDFPPPAKRKGTFGMHVPLFPESEDKSSKHTLYSTRPENDFCMNTPFSQRLDTTLEGWLHSPRHWSQNTILAWGGHPPLHWNESTILAWASRPPLHQRESTILAWASCRKNLGCVRETSGIQVDVGKHARCPKVFTGTLY